jgi:hypothetical protein
MSFIAGPYSATYKPAGGSALALGIVADGFRLTRVTRGQIITGDNLGKSVQDGVFQGSDMFLSMVCEEFNAAALFGNNANNAAQADNPFGVNFNKQGQVGRLWSTIAGEIVLTRVSANTTASFATLTAGYAIIQEDAEIEYLMATALKTVPLRFRLLPYTVSSNTVHFTFTTS